MIIGLIDIIVYWWESDVILYIVFENKIENVWGFSAEDWYKMIWIHTYVY